MCMSYGLIYTTIRSSNAGIAPALTCFPRAHSRQNAKSAYAKQRLAERKRLHTPQSGKPLGCPQLPTQSYPLFNIHLPSHTIPLFLTSYRPSLTNVYQQRITTAYCSTPARQTNHVALQNNFERREEAVGNTALE